MRVLKFTYDGVTREFGFETNFDAMVLEDALKKRYSDCTVEWDSNY